MPAHSGDPRFDKVPPPPDNLHPDLVITPDYSESAKQLGVEDLAKTTVPGHVTAGFIPKGPAVLFEPARLSFEARRLLVSVEDKVHFPMHEAFELPAGDRILFFLHPQIGTEGLFQGREYYCPYALIDSPREGIGLSLGYRAGELLKNASVLREEIVGEWHCKARTLLRDLACGSHWSDWRFEGQFPNSFGQVETVFSADLDRYGAMLKIAEWSGRGLRFFGKTLAKPRTYRTQQLTLCDGELPSETGSITFDSHSERGIVQQVRALSKRLQGFYKRPMGTD